MNCWVKLRLTGLLAVLPFAGGVLDAFAVIQDADSPVSPVEQNQVSEDASSEKDPLAEILQGHSFHGEAFNEGPRQKAYLMGGTGNVRFDVTTESELAQKFINQGVGQLHGFWDLEAERSFRQAAALDETVRWLTGERLGQPVPTKNEPMVLSRRRLSINKTSPIAMDVHRGFGKISSPKNPLKKKNVPHNFSKTLNLS